MSKKIKNFKKARERGFTIVELLIVIIVIAILAAVVISAYSNVQNSAKESAAKHNAREVANALLAFNAENDRWPEDIDELKSGSNAVNIDIAPISLMNDLEDTSRVMAMLCPLYSSPKVGAIIIHFLPYSDPGVPSIRFLGDANSENCELSSD